MGKSITQVVEEGKAKVSKANGKKPGRPTHTKEIADLKAMVADLTASVMTLTKENQALKAKPATKGKSTGYNVLDNENYAVTGTFTPNVVKIHEKFGIHYPNFNFLNSEGVPVIPDHIYRTILKAFYGADFWKNTSLWSMPKATFDRFNADLVSGAFADHGREVCEQHLKAKGAPMTEHGKAIVAFYMED